MLTVELKKPDISQSAELEIYCDREGLDSLLAQLRFLQNRVTDHVHLMSEAWGGTHLESSPRIVGNTVLHHVKIVFQDK